MLLCFFTASAKIISKKKHYTHPNKKKVLNFVKTFIRPYILPVPHIYKAIPGYPKIFGQIGTTILYTHTFGYFNILGNIFIWVFSFFSI